MLAVIFIWLYMAVTVFLLGYGILTGLSTVGSYRVKKWDSHVMCGLAGAAVYAQFFSIFGPVGFAANLSAYRFSVPEKASGGLEAAWILQEMGGGGWHFSEKNFSESFFSICIAAAVRLWGFQRNPALRYRAVPCAEHSLD